MIVDWTDEFDRRLTNAEEQVGKLPAVAVALLQALNDLPAKPDEESPTSSESGRPDAMSRGGLPTPRPRRRRPDHLLAPCQRPSRARGGLSDKKSIGDVFYASATARGEAVADAWLRQKEAPMTEEIKFIRGNDRISQLAKRPDMADGVTRVRAEMAEADRTHAMGLGRVS